jgi:hypothetical protein
MNTFIDMSFLDQDTINFLRENISENASRPLKEGIRTSTVNHLVTKAATYSPHSLGDNTFDFLKNIIDKRVFELTQTELKTYSWWVMKYKGEDYTEEHSHNPQANWVAIYYIDAPENSGALYFPDINVLIKPRTGMLVVHKADLIHGVRKNASPDIERYNMIVNYT